MTLYTYQCVINEFLIAKALSTQQHVIGPKQHLTMHTNVTQVL